ncbi:uncharacterized protein KD926_003883 [Aspergillus affinis]|uniref:uncharacterized protein n=1 Tax=Aspergillus affinis TaxID=1070780 RepID=UPI0022FF0297|nr:uncharacterized protein KD926_003883 [Aspergillus affinis]KAI9043353.1 hypothetical protein KD926_003883 [Aspergillus affinis]
MRRDRRKEKNEGDRGGETEMGTDVGRTMIPLMSATGTSDTPASGGQGDIQPTHNEGIQPTPQVTSNGIDPTAQSQNSPPETLTDHRDIREGSMEAQSHDGSQEPVAEPRGGGPAPADVDPTDATPKPEPLSGRMKGLSISTDTSSRASSSGTDKPPPPPEKDDAYLAPKPQSTLPPPSPTKLPSELTEKELPDVPGGQEQAESSIKNEGGLREDDSQPEIQNIMGQFQDSADGGDQEQIMSPRLELAEQFLSGQSYFPPRQSSLDQAVTAGDCATAQVPRPAETASHEKPPAPVPRNLHRTSIMEQTVSSRRSSTSTIPPPPEPEPDQPFDFHRFLEQLRHRTADPVAKFLRSFLHEFGKRQWMVHEQVKIISDFLAFITNKMAMCDVWRDVSDSEFDNAKEGMEKLVMNRLYFQTFSPTIPAPPSIPRSASRSKRRELERLHGPWRRGQHQEDIERDEVLAQKMRIYRWVKEGHLDIPPVGNQGARFLNLAQQGESTSNLRFKASCFSPKPEISKINGYRAPRDKVICILNCCKVIFGLLKNTKKADTSADSFIPLLIYVVLQANPEHLVSNIQYILRFRNQDKLSGEAGYYLSSLSGAIQFIETLDRTSLTVSDDEFERNVEAAVSAIAEQNRKTESVDQKKSSERPAESSQAAPARTSTDTQRGRREAAQSSDEDTAPVAGILRSIQKPLSTIGRIFSDEPDSPVEPPTQPAATPQPGARLNPNVYQPPRSSGEERRSSERLRQAMDAQDVAAHQASAEDAEARRIQRAEHTNVVETLSNMFPNLDRDVIDDVVKIKEGRVGLAVDACLALSAEVDHQSKQIHHSQFLGLPDLKMPHFTNEPEPQPNPSTSTTASTGSNAEHTNAPEHTGEQQPLSKEEADRLYEERMEEEYAKREGGA